MTLPLLKKHPTTRPSFPASTIKTACGLAQLFTKRCIAIGLMFALTICCWQQRPASADTGTSTTGPTKLVWKAARPQRADAPAANDTKDTAVQVANYTTDVFDDDPAPKPTIRLTAGQSSARNTTNTAWSDSSSDPSVDDLPSVKARRIAQRPGDTTSAGIPALSPDAAPAREVPPTLPMDTEPVQREPAELNPANPMHIGVPRNTVRTFQQPSTPAIPSTPTTDPQLDLTPGADQSPTARPRMPEQDCHEEYERVKNYTLNKLILDIAPPKDANPEGPNLPYECSLSKEPFTPRCWQLTTFTWKASALCHKPLYFEEMAAERYGHSRGPYGCEYVTSFCHFFGNLALLPYWVGVDTPCECVYDLGYYRVGDCAPYEFDAFPFSVRGACTAAVGYGGVVALFP
jgi:hypothetical protein